MTPLEECLDVLRDGTAFASRAFREGDLADLELYLAESQQAAKRARAALRRLRRRGWSRRPAR